MGRISVLALERVREGGSRMGESSLGSPEQIASKRIPFAESSRVEPREISSRPCSRFIAVGTRVFYLYHCLKPHLSLSPCGNFPRTY
jgi:hypothetical protein